MDDDLEAQILAGAVAALRRRAARQAQLAADGTIAGERGAIIQRGEAVLAARLASVFSDLAAELQREGPR